MSKREIQIFDYHGKRVGTCSNWSRFTERFGNVEQIQQTPASDGLRSIRVGLPDGTHYYGWRVLLK